MYQLNGIRQRRNSLALRLFQGLNQRLFCGEMAHTKCRESRMLRLGTAQFRVSDRDVDGTVELRTEMEEVEAPRGCQ
jgi:hypothetical protein